MACHSVKIISLFKETSNLDLETIEKEFHDYPISIPITVASFYTSCYFYALEDFEKAYEYILKATKDMAAVNYNVSFFFLNTIIKEILTKKMKNF